MDSRIASLGAMRIRASPILTFAEAVRSVLAGLGALKGVVTLQNAQVAVSAGAEVGANRMVAQVTPKNAGAALSAARQFKMGGMPSSMPPPKH